MKNSIVINIFAFHIIFAIGMEQNSGVNFANKRKVCSIFKDSPNYETYKNIFEKIIDSKQVQKSKDFSSLENLVFDMEEGDLKKIENYIKISPASKYTPLSYTCPYSMEEVEPMVDQAKLDDSCFKMKLSGFYGLVDVVDSFPRLSSEERDEIKSYVSVLNDERKSWHEKKILAPIEHKYLIHYLKKGGCPKGILENAVRFYAECRHQRAYDHVIAYTFKRYPLYVARHLVDFVLKTKNLQEKKAALAIVKFYNMLHVAENDSNLIQRIINDGEAQKLFFNYGLNLIDPSNPEKYFAFFNSKYKKEKEDATIEYIKQCYEALSSASKGDFRSLEILIFDREKLCKIYNTIEKLNRRDRRNLMGEINLVNLMIKNLSIKKPLLNPRLHPIFLNNLLTNIEEWRTEKNDEMFQSINHVYDRIKLEAGLLGIGTCYSTLFTALTTLFIRCSDSFDFSSAAAAAAVCLVLDAIMIIFNIRCYQEINNYQSYHYITEIEINLQQQINYTGGYLKRLITKENECETAIIPIEQEEKYKKAVIQKRTPFSTTLSCLTFSIAAFLALGHIAQQIDSDELKLLTIFFGPLVGIPFFSFLLARSLQVNYKDAKNNADKLFEISFERGKEAGFAAFEGRQLIVPQEPIAKPGLVKAFFGAVRAFPKNLFGRFVQRIKNITIRRPMSNSGKNN